MKKSMSMFLTLIISSIAVALITLGVLYTYSSLSSNLGINFNLNTDTSMRINAENLKIIIEHVSFREFHANECTTVFPTFTNKEDCKKEIGLTDDSATYVAINVRYRYVGTRSHIRLFVTENHTSHKITGDVNEEGVVVTQALTNYYVYPNTEDTITFLAIKTPDCSNANITFKLYSDDSLVKLYHLDGNKEVEGPLIFRNHYCIAPAVKDVDFIMCNDSTNHIDITKDSSRGLVNITANISVIGHDVYRLCPEGIVMFAMGNKTNIAKGLDCEGYSNGVIPIIVKKDNWDFGVDSKLYDYPIRFMFNSTKHFPPTDPGIVHRDRMVRLEVNHFDCSLSDSPVCYYSENGLRESLSKSQVVACDTLTGDCSLVKSRSITNIQVNSNGDKIGDFTFWVIFNHKINNHTLFYVYIGGFNDFDDVTEFHYWEHPGIFDYKEVLVGDNSGKLNPDCSLPKVLCDDSSCAPVSSSKENLVCSDGEAKTDKYYYDYQSPFMHPATVIVKRTLSKPVRITNITWDIPSADAVNKPYPEMKLYYGISNSSNPISYRFITTFPYSPDVGLVELFEHDLNDDYWVSDWECNERTNSKSCSADYWGSSNVWDIYYYYRNLSVPIHLSSGNGWFNVYRDSESLSKVKISTLDGVFVNGSFDIGFNFTINKSDYCNASEGVYPLSVYIDYASPSSNGITFEHHFYKGDCPGATGFSDKVGDGIIHYNTTLTDVKKINNVTFVFGGKSYNVSLTNVTGVVFDEKSRVLRSVDLIKHRDVVVNNGNGIVGDTVSVKIKFRDFYSNSPLPAWLFNISYMDTTPYRLGVYDNMSYLCAPISCSSPITVTCSTKNFGEDSDEEHSYAARVIYNSWFYREDNLTNNALSNYSNYYYKEESS